MKTLYIKQKIFSLGGKFTVKDENQEDVYYIEGSLMKIPKSYSIKNAGMDEVALITKKMFSFMPTFFVETVGQEDVTIKKEFTFFKPKYTINAIGIDVQGNWWDMNFKVVQNGEVIGVVDKKWFTWGDSYQIQIMKEETESLIIAIVVAIDCVNATQATTNSSV